MGSQNPNVQATRTLHESEHNGESRMREEELRERGSEMLHETMKEFKAKGDDVKVMLQEYVKEKPFKALGVAVITGMALALMLRR